MSWSFHMSGQRDVCISAIEREVNIPRCIKDGLVQSVRALPARHYTVVSSGESDGQTGRISLSVTPTPES